MTNSEGPEAFWVSALKVKLLRYTISWLLVVSVKFELSRFTFFFQSLVMNVFEEL